MRTCQVQIMSSQQLGHAGADSELEGPIIQSVFLQPVVWDCACCLYFMNSLLIIFDEA